MTGLVSAALGVTALGALALIALNGGTSLAGFGVGREAPSATAPRAADLAALADAAPTEGAESSVEPTVAASVEIPSVVGRSFSEASLVLEALGLAVRVEGVTTAAVASAAAAADPDLAGSLVTAQDPAPSVVVAQGTEVTLQLEGGPAAPPAKATAAVGAAATGSSAGRGGGVVVVIDPGHQSRGDSRHEPIGPGSTQSKPRVTGGTSGVVTRIPEYEVALQISMNLKRRLEAAGVTVVMTRTTNDVNISNAERAAVADEANAALFVRIHADGSTDSSVAGISVLYPGENRWTAPFAATSKQAATRVHDALIASTGATPRGTIARTDLSGFNWATVPSILVECGFMSNPVEDRLLSSPHYQDKLAEGMAVGILGYLGE